MKQVDYIHYMHLEISSLCNAACPCCPRFNTSSPNVVQGQFLGYISISDFKKWFPPDVLSKVKYLNFCGNHGDPGTNPDLPEIIEYISQFKLKKFQMHTNGGMKNPAFWDKVGYHLNNMQAEFTTFTFSVDGLEDTNHIYRRNVKWDKLISNIKEITKYKNIFVIWDYLVFKHNEHQLKEAEELSKKLGFSAIEFKAPVNLDDGDNITPISVLDKEGVVKYWLEPTELDEFRPSYLPDNAEKIYKENILWPDRTTVEPDFGCMVETSQRIKDANNSKVIPRCNHNDLYVEADGTVHPCCFVGLAYGSVKSIYDKGGHVDYMYRQMFEEQEKIGYNKFNLNHNTIENILSDKLLHSMYNAKWDRNVEDGKILACVNYCGKKNALDTIFKAQRESEYGGRTTQEAI